MSLDELLLAIRERRLLLLSENEIWPSPLDTRAIRRALHKHRKGIRLLIAWDSIDTCPSRDLHRKYWRYAGNGRYICEICEKIGAA